MKVKIVECSSASWFEDKVNSEIQRLEEKNHKIVDIKFGTRESSNYDFFAMIIYK